MQMEPCFESFVHNKSFLIDLVSIDFDMYLDSNKVCVSTRMIIRMCNNEHINNTSLFEPYVFAEIYLWNYCGIWNEEISVLAVT